jgi:metal-sulfur cluster biosynthetic enzyme
MDGVPVGDSVGGTASRLLPIPPGPDKPESSALARRSRGFGRPGLLCVNPAPSPWSENEPSEEDAITMDEADLPGEPGDVPYRGSEALRGPIMAALQEVHDPEIGMSILDVGLVYEVAADAGRVDIRMTMTSAACPLADQIIDDIEFQLEQVLPEGRRVEVELCWDPPWSPEKMSERGRRLMGW